MFGYQLQEYDLKHELTVCCGGLGSVYVAYHRPTHRKVAIKKIQLDLIEEVNLIQQEIYITRQLQHPNILSYEISFVNDLNLYIVAPLMIYGSCRDVLNFYNSGFPETAIAIILRDVINGLDYVHSKGFIHRGIRGSHMLINHLGTVLLSGLRGVGELIVHGKRQRVLHSLPPQAKDTLNWLSPEVLEQNMLGYNEKSDIYSLAVCACELANGVEPFADMPCTLMFTEKVRGYAPKLLDSITLSEYSNSESSDDLQAIYVQSQRAFYATKS
ncbi:STE20-related kinase adapter protein alpha-like [Ctenocephalides felis]|uniref:STE20-related kinase adapter protein alpha-like n=1 Tax=Ctenocephalides felis TaxID=7515 RepID=UPI000E6E4898|nr:STE20-related kinase adapter protein alpha-like [Ctenocephalides felis]